MNNTKLSQLNMKQKVLAAAIAALALAPGAQAIEFSNGELSGSWDTTISYGASWRMEEPCDRCIGKANINPGVILLDPASRVTAPGRFSVNSDDGNMNYDDGDLISHAIKVTSELGFSWRNFGGFFRATAFHDFENNDDFLAPLTGRFGDARDYVGEDVRLLDAYVYADFEAGDSLGTIRLGRQVVSWGENVFIQGGVNVINPVDVSKLRVAGAELKEAFLPIDQVWMSMDLTENLSMEALYMFEFEQIDPDPAGTYFGGNDFAVPGGEFVMLNFGLLDEGFPGATVPRAADRSPDDSGQYGFALRYFASELNDTEFGVYYLNYHSRLPLISGISVRNSSAESAEYFIEYPEDIEMYGFSWNTEIAGWAFAGEISYRDNIPLQVDDVELLFTALTPLNGAIGNPFNQFVSQLGTVGFGEEVRGWERHEQSQLQFSLTRIFGPNFGADQIVFLAEFGLNKVWDLPDQSELRYQGPGTDTGGGPDIFGGASRNPLTLNDGFATESSWGYRMVTRWDYSNAFGTPFTLSPRLAFNHDVNGTTPGPGGSFIEDRKSLTFGVGGSYLERWGADIAYTRFSGGGQFNLLRDRDFLGVSVRYSF
ncbi:MAG: DUF1302 domain-containing protein [Xanthomonadales bacterium]|nr:DUF1302 domain-containing protein [Xanthomonadales bacterium]